MREFDDDRMLKRAYAHDYKSRCYYMITINAVEGAPPLATLEATPSGMVRSVPTEAGRGINHFLSMFERFNPDLRVRKKVVMPDHTHFLLLVTKAIDEPIWEPIHRFIDCVEEIHGRPLLRRKFHDRIILQEGQLGRVIRYIDDNPRKLYVKRQNPDMFTVRHQLLIKGREFDAMGNLFLLNDLDIEPIVFSKHYTEEELTRLKLDWLKAIHSGSVIASPFVNPLEKKVLGYALSIGGKAIYFQTEPFCPRQKPGDRLFDACADGRLLILAPKNEKTLEGRSVRDTCLFLNSCAGQVAAGNISIF